MASQSRRAAVSIAANIAEGFKRRSDAEKARFLTIAEGSISECGYYLVLTQDLGYAKTGDLLQLLDEVGRLANAYGQALHRSPSSVANNQP